MHKDVSSALHETENNRLPSIQNPKLLGSNSWNILNESGDILLKSLELGRVRGVVGVFGFPNPGDANELDCFQIVQELINQDILVAVISNFPMRDTTEGSTPVPAMTGDGLAEFCEYLGIQPALHIQTEMSMKDVMDFLYELSEGAGIQMAELPVATLAIGGTATDTSLPGALFTIEESPENTAEILDRHIHDKRIAIQWCDRCGGRFSPFS